ncbi:MAG TPA: phosphoribosylanthranilate isomerase [Tepidisphaeraceae bacterium]|jgi:phosphoribosylanthranilate isomerase
MSRTRVKFCGMMSPADARAAADAGADAIGMVLHADARRRIDDTTAAAILAVLPPYVAAVGLFVDAPAELVLNTARTLGLATVQLHGDESPADVAALQPLRVVKALRVDTAFEATLDQWRAAVERDALPNLAGLLLDGPAGGGKGIATDFERIRQLQDRGAFTGLPPILIAGGLTPDNVGPVVERLRPFAVDTSSGIESEFGRKSSEKMRAFVKTVTDRPLVYTRGH